MTDRPDEPDEEETPAEEQSESRPRWMLGDWITEYAGNVEKVEPTKPSDVDAVSKASELDDVDHEQDIKLKKIYALSLLAGLGVLLLVTEGIFILYAGLGKHWNVPNEVMIAWLSSTVVELIGIVLVVVRYLFPPR